MQVVSHEISKPIFWENKKKYYEFVIYWSFPNSGKV